MTISETLDHILHLTLRWIRREKSQRSDRSTLLESPESISDPLGSLGYRRVNKGVFLEDGLTRTRKVKCYKPRVEE